MSNSYFKFKQFTIHQDKCAMKVTTDACLFGALVSGHTIQGKALDIGTGTGLLSLMLAQKNLEMHIDAIEIDEGSAIQAKENVADSEWSDRITIIHGDAIKFDLTGKYDLIVSNPPFYEKELKSPDSKKNVAHHNEGLLLPELIEIIKRNLAPAGRFYLLLPFKRNEEIKRMFLETNCTISKITFVSQSLDHDYFRMIIEGSIDDHGTIETSISEIAIKDKKDNYTPAFTSLLKDYYLYL